MQNIFPPVTDFGPPKIGHSAGHKPTKAPNGKAALSSITGPQLKEMKGMEVKNWNKIERAKERVYSSMHKQLPPSQIDLERTSIDVRNATFHKSKTQRITPERIKHLEEQKREGKDDKKTTFLLA